MITAIVLVTTERGRTSDVAERLAALKGVSEVYSVAGRFDLVAMLRVHQPEEMEHLVTGAIAGVDGIASTETLTAFRAYSRFDLDAAFALGID